MLYQEKVFFLQVHDHLLELLCREWDLRIYTFHLSLLSLGDEYIGIVILFSSLLSISTHLSLSVVFRILYGLTPSNWLLLLLTNNLCDEALQLLIVVQVRSNFLKIILDFLNLASQVINVLAQNVLLLLEVLLVIAELSVLGLYLLQIVVESLAIVIELMLGLSDFLLLHDDVVFQSFALFVDVLDGHVRSQDVSS